MPIYDKQCDTCGAVQLDKYESIDAPIAPCECGGQLLRAHIPGQKVSAVSGDECDISIRNGMCNPDGSPRRFTSKSELTKEAAKRGWTNYVEHKGSKGGDRSPHTTRWT